MPVSYRAAQTLIKRGDAPALQAALEAGLDPNLANQNGWSLLMLAAVEGHVAMGRLLLEQGAHPNARNHKQETALSLAAQKGHVPFLHLLLENGAATDCTPHGRTLMDWLQSAAALPEAKLAEVLQVLGLSAPIPHATATATNAAPES